MPLNFASLGYTEHENEMLQDAENAINKADMWEYMKLEPGEGGYMYGDDDQLREIYKHIKYDGHSGSSMGWTMRVMQQLAQLGIDEFCARRSNMPRIRTDHVVPSNSPVRSAEMDAKVLEVYKNLKPFQRTPKWAAEYAMHYPQLIANLKIE